MKSVDGIETTELDFATGELTVMFDAADTSPDKMIAALETAGYHAAVLSGP